MVEALHDGSGVQGQSALIRGTVSLSKNRRPTPSLELEMDSAAFWRLSAVWSTRNTSGLGLLKAKCKLTGESSDSSSTTSASGAVAPKTGLGASSSSSASTASNSPKRILDKVFSTSSTEIS